MCPHHLSHKRTTNASSPSSNDVICCRGRQYWNHPGNRYYRNLITDATQRYSESRQKVQKSLIVMQIIHKIHEHNGRFVKRQGKGGPWVEVDEVFAKEKITQSLRDGLSSKYRSATPAKRQRRARHDKIMNEDIEQILRSNRQVVQKVDAFYAKVKDMNSRESLPSDEEMMALFSQANADILETMKSDPSLHQQFQVVADTAETESNRMTSCSPSPSQDDMCSDPMGDDNIGGVEACNNIEPVPFIKKHGYERLHPLDGFPSHFYIQLEKIVSEPINIIEDENTFMEDACDVPPLLNVVSSS